MKVGIVGSRRRYDKESVIKLVDSLNENDIVVSGGCRGVDTWAEERAQERRLQVVVFRPKLLGVKNKGDMIKCFYARNQQIAECCDVLYAFVAPDRCGGTENTIKYALDLNKKVVVL